MKSIGGEFALPLATLLSKKLNSIGKTNKNKTKEDKTYKTNEANKNTFLFSSGRCSLTFLIKALKLTQESEVLLPEYLCPEMLEPFKKHSIKTNFYKIKSNMQVDLKDIKNKLNKNPNTKLLLTIHYFGFPQQQIEKLKQICRNNNTYLAEDCAQSFLSVYKNKPLGALADFSFNSLRKFIQIPDGSIFIDNTNSLKPIYKHSIKHLKHIINRLFLLLTKNNNPNFYNKYKILENLSYPKPARMSMLSEFIFNRTNLNEIKEKRIANYSYLIKNIKNTKIKPLFKALPEGVCPLGFPIKTKERDKLKMHLIKNKIYPPIHWQLSEKLKSKI